MIVIKYIKSTGAVQKVKYPGIWPNPLKGLDADIEYYEIQALEKPAYNPHQFDLVEQWNLSETKGELLNICEVSWQLQEKSQAEVISNFNHAFGSFIDSAYPLWQRIKDLNFQSIDGDLRKAQEASLRELREQRESDYINNQIFPDFNFTWI